MAFVHNIFLWFHLSRRHFLHFPSSPHHCRPLCSQRLNPSDPRRRFRHCVSADAPSSSRQSPDVSRRLRTDLSSARAEERVSEKSVCT